MNTQLYSLTFTGPAEQRHEAMRALEKTVYAEDGETRYLNACALTANTAGFNRLLFDDRDEMTVACQGPYPEQAMTAFLKAYPGVSCDATPAALLDQTVDLDSAASAGPSLG